MRVELIYTPGCNSYKKLLDKLETVIAEERLPIPVHVIESASAAAEPVISPTIRIDGDDIHELPVAPLGQACRIFPGSQGSSAQPCIDSLREILYRRWKDITERPLLGS